MENRYTKTLSQLRSEGCPYIEIRKGEKRLFYFCMLCCSEFNSKKDLTQHLKSDQDHATLVNFTNVTLLRPNPWPFNDGISIFHDTNAELIIPSVLCDDQLSNLKVDHVGTGLICVRHSGENNLQKIWCEWLGKVEEGIDSEEHDFGIVTFTCDFCLGRYESLADSVDDLYLGTKRSLKPNELMAGMESLSERVCEICKKLMPYGKDVAALFNKKTGNLACITSTGGTGKFHLYHVSCAVRWILMLESESYAKEDVDSVFCPQCQGTGTMADGDDVADPTPEREQEVIQYQQKLRDGLRAWIESPEAVERSSIGLCFPERDGPNGNVLALKLLKVYRAQV